jgi:hypothetical protein
MPIPMTQTSESSRDIIGKPLPEELDFMFPNRRCDLMRQNGHVVVYDETIPMGTVATWTVPTIPGQPCMRYYGIFRGDVRLIRSERPLDTQKQGGRAWCQWGSNPANCGAERFPLDVQIMRVRVASNPEWLFPESPAMDRLACWWHDIDTMTLLTPQHDTDAWAAYLVLAGQASSRLMRRHGEEGDEVMASMLAAGGKVGYGVNEA